jgi:hypothetical protein
MPIVIPAPEGSDESPFTVGDKLTIVEAAMIYAGSHPLNVFFDQASSNEDSLRETERFISRGHRGGNEHAERRKLTWDIYCTLKGMVEQGEIEPVQRGFLESGKLDPRRTFIRTSDLVKLAKRRGERPEYLAEFFDADAPPRKGPQLVPGGRQEPRDEPGDKPIGKPADAPRAKKTRARPAADPAKQILDKLYPNGIPDKKELPNVVLYKRVHAQLPKDISASYPSVMRAAGRRPR